MKFKKGQVSALQPIVISLVAVGITLVVAFLILAQIQANTTVAADANATAAMASVIDAADDIPGWLPIIVIVMIGSLLIGLVAFFRSRG